MTEHSIVHVTPNGDVNFDNALADGGRLGKCGQTIVVHVTTSGTSSFNIAFISSGDWVCQGTLATGAVSGKQYVLTFMSGSDGKLYEINRIGPL